MFSSKTCLNFSDIYSVHDSKQNFQLVSDSSNLILQKTIHRFNYFQTKSASKPLPAKKIQFKISKPDIIDPNDLTTTRDEWYSLTQSDEALNVTCQTVFGCKHALVSLSQDLSVKIIEDEPAYS